MGSITSANSVGMVTIAGLYPVPVRMEGYSTDDAFMADDVEIGQAIMGVDGKMSTAYIPNPHPFTITFQPDSPSIILFETLIAATKAARDTFEINATFAIPSIGKSYAMVKGVLTAFKPLPDAKKILQPVTYKMTFERIDVAAF